MIIDSDYNTLTIIDNKGLMNLRNLNDYTLMKYGQFGGNRIILKLGKDAEIVETYNEGIFNVRIKTLRTQLRDKEKICFCINHYLQNKDITPLKDLLRDKFQTSVDINLLNSFLFRYDERLEYTNDAVIVDKRFKVDHMGQAYFYNRNVKEWISLCIVASGNLNHVFEIHDKILGKFKSNYKTLEIISKVFFLLNPNISDKIFYNQLDQQTKEELKRDIL